MKIKNDFVTNSSSTSFIISSEKKLNTLMCNIEVDLFDLNPVAIRTIEELNEYCYDDQKDYNEMVEELKKGNIVYYFSIGNEDEEPLSGLLYHNQFNSKKIKNKNIKIMRDPF